MDTHGLEQPGSRRAKRIAAFLPGWHQPPNAWRSGIDADVAEERGQFELRGNIDTYLQNISRGTV